MKTPTVVMVCFQAYLCRNGGIQCRFLVVSIRSGGRNQRIVLLIAGVLGICELGRVSAASWYLVGPYLCIFCTGHPTPICVSLARIGSCCWMDIPPGAVYAIVAAGSLFQNYPTMTSRS